MSICEITIRGDGNCLFRSLSYLVFEVQTLHRTIRQRIIQFMRDSDNIIRQVETTPMNEYLHGSSMTYDGTWGTDLEILAFATLCKTTVYVSCKYRHIMSLGPDVQVVGI